MYVKKLSEDEKKEARKKRFNLFNPEASPQIIKSNLEFAPSKEPNTKTPKHVKYHPYSNPKK